MNKSSVSFIFLISFMMEAYSQHPLYIGTYTREEGHVKGQAAGIYYAEQDPESGALGKLRTVAEITNPSFVKLSPDRKYLYAVSEIGPEDGDSGLVYAFLVKSDNSLEELGKAGTGGFAPCHIETDQTGRVIFVSNYLGGVVMVYTRDPQGRLQRQQQITFADPEESHPHSVSISADNRFAYIADLGHDKIWIFTLNAEEGKLRPHPQEYQALKAGSGPRHFTFSKDQRQAWSINELNSSISSFTINPDGSLELLEEVSTLPEGFGGSNATADIHLHPSGEFLYGSNRGHNSIVAFKISKETGKLQRIGHYSTLGKTPRNFTIDPTGAFLYAANQDSGTIGIFRIEKSGGLIPVLEPFAVPTPVCLEF